MEKKTQKSKAGFSLIEVLLAALIIAIMVLGGAATMYYTGSNINAQGHRRIALELASQRLEDARQNYYYSILPADYDDTYYLTADAVDPYLLDLNNSEKSEVFTIDAVDYKMVTEIVRQSAVFEPECLQIWVNVVYREITGESVELTTLILPPEVAN